MTFVLPSKSIELLSDLEVGAGKKNVFQLREANYILCQNLEEADVHSRPNRWERP
jgi:hypothetical protein